MSRLLLEYKMWKYRSKTNFWQWLARKLPKTLVYFAAIRLMAHATTGKYGKTIVPELEGMEAIKRWEQDHGIH